MLKKLVYVTAVFMFTFGFLLIGCNGPVPVPVPVPGPLRPVPPSPYGPPAPQPQPQPQPQPGPTDVVAQLLAAHNKERAAKGKAPLAPDSKLQAAAQAHADFMAQKQRMAHLGIGDGDPWSRIAAAGYRSSNGGENVAWNQQNVAEVMKDWMASSGHRANILGNYTQCGLAVAYGPKQDPYWCSVFATPQASGVMGAPPTTYTISVTGSASSISTSTP